MNVANNWSTNLVKKAVPGFLVRAAAGIGCWAVEFDGCQSCGAHPCQGVLQYCVLSVTIKQMVPLAGWTVLMDAGMKMLASFKSHRAVSPSQQRHQLEVPVLSALPRLSDRPVGPGCRYPTHTPRNRSATSMRSTFANWAQHDTALGEHRPGVRAPY